MLTMDKTFGMIGSIFNKAKRINRATDEYVRFEFNGCWFVVNENSTCDWEFIKSHVRNGTKGDIIL